MALAAACVSLSAFVGGIGLIGGGLSIGTKLEQRLPLHGPVFGGVALTLLVGMTFARVALLAWQGDGRRVRVVDRRRVDDDRLNPRRARVHP